jgi:hypothetical protein
MKYQSHEKCNIAGSATASFIFCGENSKPTFLNCSFRRCSLIARDGASVRVFYCQSNQASAAFIATGQTTRMRLVGCETDACGEALSAENDAKIIAERCIFSACSLSAMHAFQGGHLVVLSSMVGHCTKSAIWVHGKGTHALIDSCEFRDCRQGAWLAVHGGVLHILKAECVEFESVEFDRDY